MNCNKAYLVGVLLLVTHIAAAQLFEDTRTIERSWSVQPGVLVSVNNKYGAVVVTLWEKDSVKLSVTRKVTEKSEDRLKKTTDNIEVLFRDNQRAISAETVIENRPGGLFQNLMEAGNFTASSPRTQIDYHIWLPREADLSIINKYGDVIVPSLDGALKIDLSNGNFQAGDLRGSSDLTLAFGQAQVRSIKNGKVALNFVHFMCEQSERLTLHGRSSTIQITQGKYLKLSSRRDQVTLGRLERLDADTYFSVLNASLVNQIANIKMTYGRLERLNMGAQFASCNIVAQTCDLQLLLQQPTAYRALLQWNKAPDLPEQLAPFNPGRQEEEQPIQFYFQSKTAPEKVRINLTDSFLKMEHRHATQQ